jgi:hypothetical protein
LASKIGTNGLVLVAFHFMLVGQQVRNVLICYFNIQIDLLTIGRMKKMFLSITTAFLCLAASASAQTWSTVTPTYGGGYQFHEYSPYGNSWGTNDAHLRRWVPF